MDDKLKFYNKEETDESIKLQLADLDSKWGTRLAEATKTPEPEPDKETLEMGAATSGIMDFEIWDIPIGQAAIGGFSAIFVTEVIDGFMKTQTQNMKGVVKIIGAGVFAKWGKRIPFINAKGAKVIALLMTFDALRDISPINTWANQIANKISGVIPTGGLGDQRGGGAPRENVGAGNDYYARAKGGR